MSELPQSGDAGEPNDDDLAAWLFEELTDQETLEEDLARSQRLLAKMAAELNVDPSGPSVPPGLDEDAMLEMYVEAEDDDAAGSGAPSPFAGFTAPGTPQRAASADIDALGDLDDLEDFDFTDFEDL